jgi:hypothetical protein
VVEDIPKEEFKMQYPDADLLNSLTWDEAQKTGEGWVGSDAVRVAEYWWVEQGKKEKGKRKAKETIKFCKTNGLEILKGTETTWAGSKCNIIPVLGKQMIMEGKPRLFSVVRPQKGAQQLINYTKSRIAETLSTSPISPFIGVEGQFDGYEDQWKSLNTQLTPYLTYKQVDVAGKPAPPPQRNTFEPPIQSLSSFVLQEVDDMKATTGIFDASMGAPGNETSGQQIKVRVDQANLTTMHFMDNLIRSFKKGGAVIAELIPLIYDSKREIQILGEDEAPQVVKINQAHEDENGKPQNFDMTKGKYVPIVTSGPAFDSKRSESFDTIQQVLAVNPNLINMVGDIFFRNSDMAGADQLAERFKKMLPPQLQDQDEPIPPQAHAAMMQLQQHNQALNAACQHYEQSIQALDFEKKAQIVKGQNDIILAKMKIEAQLAEAEINTKAQNVEQRLSFVEDMWKQFHDQAHDVAMQAVGNTQQQQMAQQQTQAAQQAQAQAQQQDQQPGAAGAQ